MINISDTGPLQSVKIVLTLQRACIMHFLYWTQVFSKTSTQIEDLWLVQYFHIYIISFDHKFSVRKITFFSTEARQQKCMQHYNCNTFTFDNDNCCSDNNTLFTFNLYEVLVEIVIVYLFILFYLRNCQLYHQHLQINKIFLLNKVIQISIRTKTPPVFITSWSLKTIKNRFVLKRHDFWFWWNIFWLWLNIIVTFLHKIIKIPIRAKSSPNVIF